MSRLSNTTKAKIRSMYSSGRYRTHEIAKALDITEADVVRTLKL